MRTHLNLLWPNKPVMKAFSFFALIIVLLIIMICPAYSQNGVLVAPTSGTADPSAMLEVRSTLGFLAPRMLASDRTSISSPATGLLVFQTDAPAGFWYYNGSTWVQLSTATGTVTNVSVTTANGVSGTVSNSTTTPAISLTLGAITPTSVAASGTVTGSNISGTNTGDQTITLTGNVTGSGTGSFATTIANNAVTYAKMQTVTASRILGNPTASAAVPSEISIGSGLNLTTGGVLSATATSMTYPGAGIAVSTGSAWGTSITDNSANWNTAYTYRLLSASGTAPLTLTLSSNALTGSIALANTSTSGYLSSTDWNTFNNKLGTSAVSGTSGQVAYFNGTNSVTSSSNHTYTAGGQLYVTGSVGGGGVLLSSNSNTTAGSSGIVGSASGASGSVYGLYGTSTSSSSGMGVVGVGYLYGVDGESSTASGSGVRGLATGSGTAETAVYGINSSTGGGAVNQWSVYGVTNGTQGTTGSSHIGVLGAASGGSYNYGIVCVTGETVISNSQTISSTPQLARSLPGSLFTQVASATTTGGRIWWSSGGYNFYVNSSGSADYSEYFYTADNTLGVGEVVSLDPDHANGVRRARPSDVSKTVGIVSIGGMRLNDNNLGNRQDDTNSVNVGMVGQVPVLISTENGDIKPGDALTLSAKYRGRAMKATTACRIIGYATTHFPYVDGEKDYETDINGGSAMKLTADHVMCYLNVGWYEPANTQLGDGVELPVVESAHAMMKRLNSITAPHNVTRDARELLLKTDDSKASSQPLLQSVTKENSGNNFSTNEKSTPVKQNTDVDKVVK